MGRILARGALAVLGLLAIVLLAAALVLTHLDHPWVKPRLLAQVHRASGFELDYRALALRGLSGLHLEGLVVRNPKEVRAAAPDLARLESLDLSWSPAALPRLEQVKAHGLSVVLVSDVSGASSLGEDSDEPGPGLSRQLSELFRAARPLDQAVLTDLSFTSLRTSGDQVLEKSSVRGVGLTITAAEDGTGWKLDATTGPLEVEVRRDGEDGKSAEASLRLSLDAQLTATGASVRLDAEAPHQTFVPDLTAKDLIHAQARARFEPEKQRVSIDLEPSRLAGVLEVEGALSLPDDPSVEPVLTRGSAQAHLQPLLALLPAGTVPFTLEDGELRFEARELALSAVPRLGRDGALDLKVSASRVQLPPHQLGGLKLGLTASPEPSGDGLKADANVALEAVDVRGGSKVQIPSGTIALHARKLAAAIASPAKVAGEINLSVAIPSLGAEQGKLRAAAEQLGLELSLSLPQRPPFALKAQLPVGQLRLADAAGRKLLATPANVQLELNEVEPAQRSGTAKLGLDLGGLRLDLDATGGSDEVAYSGSLVAPRLDLLTPFLPADFAARAPWEQLSAKVESSGRVTQLKSNAPQGEHRTTLTMPRVEWGAIWARDVEVTLHSKGDLLRHESDGELKIAQLRVGEHQLGPQHHTATAQLNRRTLEFNTTVASRSSPRLSVATAVAWVPHRRVLKVKTTTSLESAEGAGPLLAALEVPSALDTSALKSTLSLEGEVSGLVERVTADGEVRVVKDPAATAGFDGDLALDVSGFRWNAASQGASVPALKWRAKARTEGTRRSVHSMLELERLVLRNGEQRVIATNLVQDLNASLDGSLRGGALTLTQKLDAASLEQRPALPVPVKNVTLWIAGEGRDGVIRLSEAQLTSPETRSELSMRGTLDLTEDRRQLSVRGTLKQDLEALKLPQFYEGRGGVELAFRVASPDLKIFRTRSKLRFKDVSVKVADSDLEVAGLEGEISIQESFANGAEGLVLNREPGSNPYSMLRYADQHPLLSQNSFITARSITTPLGLVAPFAGNLTIEQNVVALSQLELGLRKGRVTGQCTLELLGRDSRLEAHVRATGVQSSRGEPFDGNAALVISARDRSVDGRAEVLRIGSQHLLDLLDVQDPARVDPSLNRVRSALAVGYPEHLRLVFDHGFASMRISFGGLAGLIKVDDVRGIPVGPLVSRALNRVSGPESSE